MATVLTVRSGPAKQALQRLRDRVVVMAVGRKTYSGCEGAGRCSPVRLRNVMVLNADDGEAAGELWLAVVRRRVAAAHW
ncbi:AraC family transcriptional regulator [Sesbania bispinosa]|nr:AraC family transcriptional regulator [Sesbania bispinosa]